jgi:hypothetical protein
LCNKNSDLNPFSEFLIHKSSGQIHPNSAGYLRMASSLALTMALHPPKPLPLQTGRDGSGGL